MPLAWLTRRRSPAVSTNRQILPPSSTSESTGSTVVPATASHHRRAPPRSACSAATTCRRSACRAAPPGAGRRRADALRGVSGNASSTASSRSPEPRPCSARHRERLPQPQRPQRRGVGLGALVVDLVRHQDHRRRGPAQHLGDRLVGRGRADHASTTRITASAVCMARRPARRHRLLQTSASGSQPPVSTTVNLRPAQFAS